MEISDSLNFLNSFAFLLFLKAATLIILAIYTIFAVMIVRQVGLMGRTLITPVSSIVKLFSIIHLLFAIGLTLFAWMTL